jgi:hypothetical protein
MTRLIKLASIGLAILLTGCAATGVKYSDMATSITTVRPDQARVYFLRSNSVVGAALQPEIHFDNAVVGQSKPGGFFYIDTTPGDHVASTTTEVERKLTFALDAGETKYVKTTISMGVFVGHVTPELVSQDDAMKELPELKYTGTNAPTIAPATTVATREQPSTTEYTPVAAPVTATVATPVAEAAPAVTTVAVPQQQYAAPYSPSELRRPAPVAPAPVVAAPANPAPSAPVQTYSVPDNNVAASNNTPAYAAAVSQPVSKGGFQLGVSSNTVERLARQSGCESKQGAALISESGPAENYRMTCLDGKVFVAHCEFRQCTAMQYQ